MSLLRDNVAGKDTSIGWKKIRKNARSQRKKVDPASRSGAKPDGALNNSPAFAEDFMLEHSRSGVRMTMIVVPATTDEAALQESLQSSVYFGFPS